MTKTSNAIVELNDVSFSWTEQAQPVLSIAELGLGKGERLFLRGPSGSGKTTLLSLIAAVLVPQQGSIVVDDISLASFLSIGGKKPPTGG